MGCRGEWTVKGFMNLMRFFLVTLWHIRRQNAVHTVLGIFYLSVCVLSLQNDNEHYMQTGDAYLLLYSITDRTSFLRASELRITLRRFRPAQHTPIILVGNKCDLVRRREVSVSGKSTSTIPLCLGVVIVVSLIN